MMKLLVLQRLTAPGNESDYANRASAEKYQKESDRYGYKGNAAEASDLVEDCYPG
jgi:hypothetical protein